MSAGQSETLFGHLREAVPSICFRCTLASPAVKPSDLMGWKGQMPANCSGGAAIL